MMTTLKIQGIHCVSCKTLIEDVCREMPGVTSCDVSMDESTVRIEHDASVAVELLQKEIEALGEYKTSRV